MPSLISRFLPAVITLLGYKRVYVRAQTTLDGVQDRLVRPVAYGPPRRLGRDLQIDVSHAGGWPVYQVAPRHGTPGEHVVYVHGGSWINEIHPFHWRLIAEVCARSGASITVPIYPLAPVGTAGTVVPVIADLLQALADRHGAGHVTAMGDSAGGQIALSAALLLRQRGAPALGNTVLISPALDLTFANPDIDPVEPRDPWLARPGVRAAAQLWRGELPIEHMLVSPLFAEVAGLGPLTVFSGTRDITNPDTRLLVAKARAAGVDVDYHEGADLIHVYPLLPTPEGKQARQTIIRKLGG